MVNKKNAYKYNRVLTQVVKPETRIFILPTAALLETQSDHWCNLCLIAKKKN